MRVKMKEAMAVTVDGVHTLDLEAGESYELGDAVAENLVDVGKADPDGSAEASPSRGPRRGGKKPADENKDAGAADENKEEA